MDGASELQPALTPTVDVSSGATFRETAFTEVALNETSERAPDVTKSSPAPGP